jgi:serine/threonine-protein kinase
VRLADRYALQRRIASGGSAAVWQALDERLGRVVAVKILHPHLLPDTATRRRFAAEARATAALSHPGIVPIHDVLEEAGTVAIILQHIDGETLADRIRRAGRLAPDIVVTIGLQLAGALDHAHRAGIVHRDLKPANVVVDREDNARLVDFGIARLLDDAEAHSTDDQVLGTLRYMAPEQLAGGPVDARTDLHALGLVLAEMLTGRPVFEASSPAELLRREAVAPSALEAAPPWLRELIERLLAASPADRPPSARAVALALGGGSVVGWAVPADAAEALPGPTPGDDATVAVAAGPRTSPRPWSDATRLVAPGRIRRAGGVLARPVVAPAAVLGVAALALVLVGALSSGPGSALVEPSESPATEATPPAAEPVEEGAGEAPGLRGRGEGGDGAGDNGRGKGRGNGSGDDHGKGKGKGRGGAGGDGGDGGGGGRGGRAADDGTAGGDDGADDQAEPGRGDADDRRGREDAQAARSATSDSRGTRRRRR